MDIIAHAGDRLWKDLVGAVDMKTAPMKITNVQLAFTGVETADPGQQSIEGFLKADTRDLQAQKRLRTTNDGNSNEAGETDNLTVSASADQDLSTTAFFVCPRCNKRVFLPVTWAENGGGEDAQAAAMATLKMEHGDFHFAQDLARTPDQGVKRIKLDSSSKRKKIREDTHGIAKFFTPR